MMEAIEIYRTKFRPSERFARPYVMLGFNVMAADTDEEAHVLSTSVQQAVVNLRSGRPSTLPPPVADYARRIGPAERAMLEGMLSCSAIGSPARVRSSLEAFITRTGADELMITSQIFDHAARLRSYEIVAETCITRGTAPSGGA
jgi:alkanesulfonate monooxygenase SsuD/methylene tetrahydromethanopterin reductase-like flavin-dependent oxidoreductase (luciferase family)